MENFALFQFKMKPAHSELLFDEFVTNRMQQTECNKLLTCSIYYKQIAINYWHTMNGTEPFIVTMNNAKLGGEQYP